MFFKNIHKPFSAALCIISVISGLSGCAEKELAEPEIAEGTGCLNVEIALPKTKADADAEYNALNYSTVRIYSIVRDTDNTILESNPVRKYRPASEMPANLYLAAGEYKITVEAGKAEEATFTDKTYYGEETFILEANKSKPVKVKCKITNIAVKVVFDQTVKTAFDKGFKVLVSASDEFSKEDAEGGNVPSLEFAEDATGFFILPEDVSNLSWGFYGSSSDEAVNAKGTKTGILEQPQPGMQYTLTYKYSKDADGYLLSMSVEVVDYDELCEDQFVFSPQPGNDAILIAMIVGGIVAFILAVIFMCGLKTVNPNEALVLTLFGKYHGTIKKEGFFWVNPFCAAVNPARSTMGSAKKLSLKAMTLNNEKQKVNDEEGNPIEISVVVIWRIVNTARAVFNVDNYMAYLSTQCDAAIRQVARQYPYDVSTNGDEKSLRGSAQEVADILKGEIQTRTEMAGIEILEARISHLAYAPEIAAAMLQRQQASAIIAARQKIVEGAVSMVKMALDKLSDEHIVELDDEKKAQMVSNLLVVLCGNKDAQPVVNSGSV